MQEHLFKNMFLACATEESLSMLVTRRGNRVDDDVFFGRKKTCLDVETMGSPINKPAFAERRIHLPTLPVPSPPSRPHELPCHHRLQCATSMPEPSTCSYPGFYVPHARKVTAQVIPLLEKPHPFRSSFLPTSEGVLPLVPRADPAWN